MNNEPFDITLCMANGERLARLEEAISNVDKKLDSIIDHPCARCQNTEKLARLSTEMRFFKWVSGTSFAAVLTGAVAWLVNK